MLIKFALPVLALIVSFSSLAFDDSQRQAGLEKSKAIEMKSHQSRISILQTADACLKAAITKEAAKACEEQERNARKSSLEEAKNQRQKLKAEHMAAMQERQKQRLERLERK